MSIRVHLWLKLALWGLPLAWLWFRLIDHLRLEWAVNPQYAYGWAVPFLCLYLLGRKADMLKPETLRRRAPFSFAALQRFSVSLLAFLYLPTRLIQEANPEWRLVSWALALEVIGITLLMLKSTEDGGGKAETLKAEMLKSEPFQSPAPFSILPTTQSPAPFSVSAFQRFSILLAGGARFTFHVSRFTFPICFFLVTVPWPTFVEAPLVQGLMRANIGVTTELLGVLGVPAVQHGNVIEVATGMVGIDDACSGIRSFQAALMIALFLGELYALSAGRRVLCVFAGFGLSFLFNVARTTLLTWVAAHRGTAAIASWHDPAGVTILVACFLCVWLIARGLRGKTEMLKAAGGKAEMLKTEMLKTEGRGTEDGGGKAGTLKSEILHSPAPFSFSAFQLFSIFLSVWLLVVEAGTELWYRSHESRVPMATAWHVEFPRDNATFRELPFSDKTRQFLRYDEGENGTWQEGADQRWQAIFLRWNPGQIAVHLAKSHTPEVCLTAAGRELISQSALRPLAVRGLRLPFRSYVVRDESGPLHVFYCLWEDRANAQSFRTTMMTYGNRLAPVLAGRRNSGQRSLEVAVWGIADQEAAEAALTRELEKLIKLEKPLREYETTDHKTMD